MEHYFRKLASLAAALFTAVIVIASPARAGEELEISKDFTLFTSDNLQGYLKPLFTTVEESFHSNLYSSARYADYWTISLDLSVPGMFIPNSQKTYDAELPDLYGTEEVVRTVEYRNGVKIYNVSGMSEQPTIYGGFSSPVYASPQNHRYPDSTYKSVAFVEGNDISFMPGLPILQLVTGFPWRGQLRFRFLTIPVQEQSMTYLGFMYNQQLDHFFDLFKNDTTIALALNFSYHMMNRTEGISVNSMAIGAHFSKHFNDGFHAYAGLQYENMSGEFEAIRSNYNPTDNVNSPYPEVRNGDPLKFDIETFTNFRVLGGLSYRTGFLEIHGDAGWASQPVLNIGVTFWIASFGKKEREYEKIERFEEFERIERIKREEKKEKK
jgi:hypothetical protein